MLGMNSSLVQLLFRIIIYCARRRWILAAYLEGRDVLKEDTGTVDQTLVLLRQLEQTAETLKDASTRKHFEELLRTAEILQDAT